MRKLKINYKGILGIGNIMPCIKCKGRSERTGIGTEIFKCRNCGQKSEVLNLKLEINNEIHKN